MFSFPSLFDPFPPASDYSDAGLLPFLMVAAALLIAAFFLSRWSRANTNPVTKKLSKSWPRAAFIFGFIALILVVSRAESIQYISMPFWWVVWAVLGLLYVTLQYRVFKSRHYEVVKSERVEDPRAKYLPRKRK